MKRFTHNSIVRIDNSFYKFKSILGDARDQLITYETSVKKKEHDLRYKDIEYHEYWIEKFMIEDEDYEIISRHEMILFDDQLIKLVPLNNDKFKLMEM